MQLRPLGTSDLHVSSLCLGTMTFGEQNSMADAHAQLDCAVAAGINFIDTAEMYPVPARAETQGSTESYIGHWLKHQPRERLILASKVAGPRRGMTWLRDGEVLRLNRQQMEQALHGSLRRLQTDYLDLYQIHWPERYVPMFGETEYDPARVVAATPIAEQIQALAGLMQAGKIRHYGLSNETPWGMAEFVRVADSLGLPRPVSVQNAYNLLNRSFEMGMTEIVDQTHIPLLAYSPLAFGLLTGKYRHQPPAASRMLLYPGFGARYHKTNVPEASSAYAELAEQAGLTPAQLALAFVHSRWFVGSTIIGATTLPQLQENLSCTQVTLSDDVLEQIQRVHRRLCNPAM